MPGPNVRPQAKTDQSKAATVIFMRTAAAQPAQASDGRARNRAHHRRIDHDQRHDRHDRNSDNSVDDRSRPATGWD